MKIISTIIYFIAGIIIQLHSQTNYISSNVEFGKIIPHHQNVKRIIEDGTKAISVGWEKHTSGIKKWEQEYNRPSYGIQLKYSDLGNSDELGQTISISPYFGFHSINKKNFHWYNKIGVGLLYSNTTFNINDNAFNKVIGSKFNCTVILKSEIQIEIKKFNIISGVGLNHISNGNSNTPNLGLNDIFFTLGLNYKISENESSEDQKFTSVNKIDKKIHPKILLSFGASSLKPAGVYPTYLTTTINLGIEKQLSFKLIIETGIDFLQNTSHIQSILRSDKIDDLPSNLDILRIGWYLGYNVKIADLRIIINAGYYLKNKYNFDGSIYQRLGLRYYIAKNIITSFALRAHNFSVADHFELGIGYKF